MTWLFAMFYLVPAAFAALAFWVIWRLTRLIDLSLSTRRAIFVVLGTLALAPMLVPAGVVYVAWVPHALLLAEPDPAYYIRFARYVVPSFLITAAIFWLIARRWVVRSDTLSFSWLTLVPLLATSVVIAGVYRYTFPSRDIPRALNRSAVEAAYGEHLDDVIALLSVDDDAQRQAEIARLHALFSADRRVLRVSLEDPGLSYKSYGKTFFHLNTEAPPSISCSGTVVPSQSGLIRCTWSFGKLNRRDVIRYKRSFEHNDETLEVVIELDYDDALTLARR